MTGVLVAAGLIVAWMGQRAVALASARPAVAWALDPASNTVTIRLRPGGGPSSRQILARSHLTVSQDGSGKRWTQSRGGGPVGVPVPTGRRTRLTVQVTGPAPFSQALTVAAPPALRVTASRRDPGGMVTLQDRLYIAIPATLRRRCGLRPGDRVLLAGLPGEGILAAYSLAVVDRAIRAHGALPHAFGGQP